MRAKLISGKFAVSSTTNAGMMVARSLGLVALLTIALATHAGEPKIGSAGGSQQVARSKTILYVYNRAFWTVNVDDLKIQQLTQERKTQTFLVVQEPVWSPDGAKIAFESNRAPDGSDALTQLNIWVMNADGSNAIVLTHDPAVGWVDPVWSPDGRKLAASAAWYEGQNRFGGGIGIMNADGSGSILLIRSSNKLDNTRVSFSSPAWSPDGRKLAFISDRALDGNDDDTGPRSPIQNIWMMNSDGSGVTPLTKFRNTGFVLNPGLAWSPDGRKLVYTSNRALDGSDAKINVTNIWTTNSDGSGSIPLTRLDHARASFPVWSPDGSRVAFSSNMQLDSSDNDNHAASNIWVIKADGSSAVPLTKFTAAGTAGVAPAWSLDGSLITYISNRALDGSDAAPAPQYSNLWVMQADGSGTKALTRVTEPSQGMGPGFPQWRP